MIANQSQIASHIVAMDEARAKADSLWRDLYQMLPHDYYRKWCSCSCPPDSTRRVELHLRDGSIVLGSANCVGHYFTSVNEKMQEVNPTHWREAPR